MCCCRRLPDSVIVNDDSCTGLAKPTANCLGVRAASQTFPVLPVCWDYNDTVVANAPCRAPKTGQVLNYCIEVAFSQNAYIVQCGGVWKDSRRCGTFLEIHTPGDDTVLAEVKLAGQFTNGYRQTILSTQYQGRADRTLCSGPHEVRMRVVERNQLTTRFMNRFGGCNVHVHHSSSR